MKLLSFDEALKVAKNYNKKHLLLGNGFSIACIPASAGEIDHPTPV